KGGRTGEVREHHGDLTAFGSVLSWLRKCRGSCGRRRVRRLFRTQSSDGIQQHAAMAESLDAKLLEVLRRQPRQNLLVDLVLAERGLIPFETKAPQPFSEVHGSAACLAGRDDPSDETACPGQASARRTARPVAGVPARTYPKGVWRIADGIDGRNGNRRNRCHRRARLVQSV